jgi:hypothetical protein
MRYRKTMLVAAALALAVLAVRAAERARKHEAPARAPLEAEKAKKPNQDQQFMRLARDARRQPLALEAAIVTYVPQDCGQTSPTVDLVAAVHVAEKGYYQQLNQEFSKYDVVLYELVAPEGTRVPQGARPAGKHPITLLQTLMTTALSLQFQLECIDYTKPNLIHADMSPQQLAEAMQKRGESFWTMFWRMVVYSLAKQGYGDDIDSARLVAALLDKNRSVALKRLMAEQFRDMEDSLMAIEGPKGSALISDRNKVALGVLRKQIAAGKKRIAIFYGAAHMPDFDRQLRDQFGLVPIATRWLTAWDLQNKGKR